MTSHNVVKKQIAGRAGLTRRKIVMAGNPNVGKSVLFNALTGLNADVSNYPGTTIDVSRGYIGKDELIDTPGIYGVSSFNDEERIARKIILEADIVVNVVSALSLDRDLFVTLQLIDMGKSLVVVVNQWDEAVERGLEIDLSLLSESIGIPVIPSVAVESKGISEIIQTYAEARPGHVTESTRKLLRPLLDRGIDQGNAILILEGDQESATENKVDPQNYRSTIYRNRRHAVNHLVEQCIKQNAASEIFTTKLGRQLLNPVFGSAVALAVCYLIFYQLLGVFIAGDVVAITENRLMQGYYEPAVHKIAANVFPTEISVDGQKFEFPAGTLANPDLSTQLDRALDAVAPERVGELVEYDFWAVHNIWSAAGNIIAGEYGVLTLTVTYLVGLLMPLVLGFYLGLSLMEDSGYLPRLAVLVDRFMNKMGLNGRAIIPMILGLGCVTMATITTRLLKTNREKIIATALLGVAIPCSAQLGVVSGVLAKSGGFLSWAFYGGIIFGILGVTGWLLNKIMPGKSDSLMIDIPPMRWPRMDNVLQKTWKKSWNFFKESVPMFIIAGLVVSLAQVTGLLDAFVRLMQPITVGWLHLPDDPRIPTTFILGIVRRDFGAFGLAAVGLTAVQAVVAMVVITLFVPCIATVGVMIKERGLKIAIIIWVGSWIAAFAIGGALAHLLPPLFELVGV